ncbi:MAG: pyridoxine 5'-phosphate synthase, partial [Pirellulales bacterium]|nr:pyridoxine 5'-phosphate synthase [Pirellulales bacterium]
ACQIVPDQVTLVPENREEVTTEGGLDVVRYKKDLVKTIGKLRDAGITVSLFIDPEPAQIETAASLSVPAVELHTGAYANAGKSAHKELQLLAQAATFVHQAGLILNAGHGLTYRNVTPIAQLEGMEELNIGHSIVGRAVFVGMTEAVREMKNLITRS